MNNKPAKAYAKPHTMSGGSVKNTIPTETGAKCMDHLNISVGGISKGNYAPANKNGEMKTRGNGAATKGTMARGPMA